ncbi:uncharacterized protein BDV17DRAFT_254395 [Aspergillus undulatus]|uniref:uncharacterized protein n=1 Tax=Aspergillus undulatus TaxID=1810928 RepID=UPI003CCD62FD
MVVYGIMVGYLDEQVYSRVSDSIEETIKSKFAAKGAQTHEKPLLATRSYPPSHFTQWNFPDGTSADEIRETVQMPRGVFFLVDEEPERI